MCGSNGKGPRRRGGQPAACCGIEQLTRCLARSMHAARGVLCEVPSENQRARQKRQRSRQAGKLRIIGLAFANEYIALLSLARFLLECRWPESCLVQVLNAYTPPSSYCDRKAGRVARTHNSCFLFITIEMYPRFLAN